MRSIVRDGKPYPREALEDELVDCARLLVKRYPNVGAIVLECTQMPPLALKVQEAVKLPVYDVFTLGTWFYSGLVRRPFAEWTKEDYEGAKVVRPRSEKELTESSV